jgi:hypothetical protein
MGAGRSKLFVVNPPTTEVKRKKRTSRTDETISQSGIYRVIHGNHLLPHEVTLLRNQKFPRCARCNDAVKFQLARRIKLKPVEKGAAHICLYELPVLDDSSEEAIAI